MIIENSCTNASNLSKLLKSLNELIKITIDMKYSEIDAFYLLKSQLNLQIGSHKFYDIIFYDGSLLEKSNIKFPKII